MDFGAELACELGRNEAASGEPGAPAAAEVDVAIIGAGLSGALLALALARSGVSVAVVDATSTYKSDFRCEKLNAEQVERLKALDLLDAVRAAVAPGELSDTGFHYERAVNAVRAAWPECVHFITGRVSEVVAVGEGDEQRQHVISADGDLAHARLAVLATGLSPKLAARLGLTRQSLREQQSLCVGFSLKRKDGAPFGFEGLVHRGERAGDKIGFVSLFRLGETMRINLFSYHEPTDPWVREAKRDPLGALSNVAPQLALPLADMELAGPVEIRATGLYRAEGVARAGLVLIGDAFQTSCPATAFGVTRLLSDIHRLVRAHLPLWLATPGMGAEKIAAYYADPIKQAVDAEGLRRAARDRSMAVETSLYWRAYRLASRLKRQAAALRRPARPARARRPLQQGDWVEVRSAAEIAASLDAGGRLDGLAFMPEMAALCGRRLRVHRRAEKTCVEGHGLRGMTDAVLLENARCDGAFHNGCERGCLMFWKEAWLRPLRGGPRASATADAEAREALESMPVVDADRYICQSTTLAEATFPLSRRNVGHLLADLRRGEVAFGRLVEIGLRTLANMVRRRLGLGEIGALRGDGGDTRVSLKLKPGDQVRVKAPACIAATLDARGKNRGLTFEPEMTLLAGGTYTVAGPVKRIIMEETGRFMHLKSTVALEGVNCQGRCARNCPRSNPLYWRESWLEPV